jgi:hypothetical protein
MAPSVREKGNLMTPSTEPAVQQEVVFECLAVSLVADSVAILSLNYAALYSLLSIRSTHCGADMNL